MSYSEDKFRDHIRTMVEKTSVDHERPLTLDELKELALDMGLLESEWDALLLKAEDSLQLAMKHLAVKNYQNAVESAEEATSINPYIKDGNAVLAQAYYQLSLQEKNEKHLAKAGEYAKRELLMDPMDATALHVLSAVETQHSEGRYSKKLFQYLGIGGAILVVLFLVISYCSRQTSNQQVTDILRNGDQTEQMNLQLISVVEQKERLFKEAVQRRNNFLIAWYSTTNNDNARQQVENFDFDDLANSEKDVKRNLGTSQNSQTFTPEERITLEGLENRMAVEKKRWIEAITAYNSFLQSNPKAQKELDKIQFPD